MFDMPPPPKEPTPPPSEPSPGSLHGRPPRKPLLQAPPQATTKAVVTLVLGIVGLFLFSAILGPMTIIIGHKAISEIDSSNGRLGGRGLALAGLILGYVSLAFAIIAIFGLSAVPD